ncbi:MAG: NifU family protein [Gemmatimonadales bacterium]
MTNATRPLILRAMDVSAIKITAEPVDNERCKFVLSGAELPSGVRRFGSAADSRGSPLAERLFEVPGVTEVLVSGSTITLTKDGAAPWQMVGKQVGQAIRAAFAAGPAVIAPKRAGAAGPGTDDDALFERVTLVFEDRVNPMVSQHGGMVELVDVQDAVVMLRMSGGCQGSGMAQVTLRQGIEGILRDSVPEVKGVVDVTDHTAGANPYFASSKK